MEQSKKSAASTSIAESEYYAMSQCAKEIKRVYQLLCDIRLNLDSLTVMYYDNFAARTWSKEFMGAQNAKHVEVRLHYIRQCVMEKSIKVVNITSIEKISNGLTKALTRTKSKNFARK